MSNGRAKPPFDYQLTLQVPADSLDRALLEYIQQSKHPTYVEKDLVLVALRMCWLPSAYKSSPARFQRKANEDLQQLGLDAITRLKEQIRYIATVTGLQIEGGDSYSSQESSQYRSSPPSPPLASANSPSSEPPKTPTIATAIVPLAMEEPDGYERDLFGD